MYWRNSSKSIFLLYLLHSTAFAITLDFTLQQYVDGTLQQKTKAPSEIITHDIDSTTAFGGGLISECFAIGEGDLGSDRVVRQLDFLLSDEEATGKAMYKSPKAIALYLDSDCSEPVGTEQATRLLFFDVVISHIPRYRVEFDKVPMTIELENIESHDVSWIGDGSWKSGSDKSHKTLNLNGGSPLLFNNIKQDSDSSGSPDLTLNVKYTTRYYDMRKPWKGFKLAWKSIPHSAVFCDPQVQCKPGPTLVSHYGEFTLNGSPEDAAQFNLYQTQED